MQNIILSSAVVVLSCFLYGCHNDNKAAQHSTSELIIDPNPKSCTDVIASTADDSTAADQSVDPTFPEPASGYRFGLQAKTADRYMVVTNTPLATQVGCEVLKAGGSAIDAAIAIQAVLGLVEPQSSTIAGSAFMLYYDVQKKQLTAYDGRETAPAAATGYYLSRVDQHDENSATPVPSARRSGRSIGVPGVMSMFEMAHAEHGKLKWQQLFDRAIYMADNGFAVPGRLADAIVLNKSNLALDQNAVNTYFKADGRPYQRGEILKNPAYAATLKSMAKSGAEVMYSGPIAQHIVEKAAQSLGDDAARTPITPSLMTLEDLKNYKAVKRQPLCTSYRQQYYVCSMPPPSSGGIAVAQSLGILENFDLSQYPPTNIEYEGGIPHVMAVHLVAEAERLAYADRDQYVADTDFVPLPAQGLSTLLDKNYLKQRAALIDPNRSMGVAAAGDFNLVNGKDSTVEQGTTQFTIVDTYGNVASVTSTVESSMGSFHMVDGFLLSNQLTDFSAYPQDNAGRWVANRVEANKRPRSTMAPTIVFKGDTLGDVYIATGSPGGGTIIQFVVKTLVSLLDWKLDAQQASSLPNFGATNSVITNIDSSNPRLDLAQLLSELSDKGHIINQGAQTSGVATIVRNALANTQKYTGGVDPRREGLVLGNHP